MLKGWMEIRNEYQKIRNEKVKEHLYFLIPYFLIDIFNNSRNALTTPDTGSNNTVFFFLGVLNHA